MGRGIHPTATAKRSSVSGIRTTHRSSAGCSKTACSSFWGSSPDTCSARRGGERRTSGRDQRHRTERNNGRDPDPGGGDIEPAVMAAVVGGGVALISLAGNAIVSSVRESRNRRREGFSKAFAACVAYEEYPYVVRRRRASDPEGERIRISSELRVIQEQIGFYSAWMRAESPDVFEAYDRLVRELRARAGGQIREGWKSSPIESDEGMNMPDLGLGELAPHKAQFLGAVAANLAPVRARLRRRNRALSPADAPSRSRRAWTAL